METVASAVFAAASDSHRSPWLKSQRASEALSSPPPCRRSAYYAHSVFCYNQSSSSFSNSYWGYIINANKEFFDDAAWDKWVAENGPVATPGAVDFLSYAQSKGVEVFYVTSRDQGEKTYEYALANLRKNNLPFADEKHLTVYRESSNKEPRQSEIAKDYDVVVMLGDNLNDFKRKYYVADVKQRNGLMAEDKEQFGRKFIIFPNPTDGHWLKAIFGDSEPPATPENRAKFKAAASSTAWQLKQ